MEKTISWKHYTGKPMTSTFRLVKHQEGEPNEWWAILWAAENGESLQNKWGGYSTKNSGSPKYIKKIWKDLS